MSVALHLMPLCLQIEAIKESYTKQFKRDLEKDLMSESGGSLKRIFVSLVQVGQGVVDGIGWLVA